MYELELAFMVIAHSQRDRQRAAREAPAGAGFQPCLSAGK